MEGQRERENNALMDTILACQKSLSDALATNKCERQAWEKQQQQLLEEMEGQMQKRFAVLEETVQELRSDVDALVKFSDIYILNMAAEILKRFLKKQSNVGASWSASSVFEDHEKDIVRTSLQEFGVTCEVEQFAELSAHLLNARNSAIRFAEEGDNLPSLAQEVVQVLESLSRSRALNSTLTFALTVLKVSGGLLSRV
jgi:hypothetical protein